MCQSEFSPIELIWTQVNSQVARKNNTFRIADIKNLIIQLLNDVTPSNLKNKSKKTCLK